MKDHKDQQESAKNQGAGQEDSAPNTKHKRLLNPHTFFSWRITYSKVSKDQLIQILTESKIMFSQFSVEKGKKGNLHYQGVSKPSAKSRWKLDRMWRVFQKTIPSVCFPTLDYCEGMHINSWSKAIVSYTEKSETHIEGPFTIGELDTALEEKDGSTDFDLKLSDLPKLYPWQQIIADRHKDPPPLFHSKIYWYYEPRGQIGKTMLGRYFHLKHKAIYLQGAGRHILATAFNNPSFWYIFGLTRSDENRISYRALESLNDNFYMSGFGSDATGMRCRKTAWTIVFANFKPQLDCISTDRWVIENLNETHNLYELNELEIPECEDF